jgi:hypothetical protein
LIGLLSVWAVGLITGFAVLHWSLGTALVSQHDADVGLATYLYFSGTTFFTLGYGDVVPTGVWGRTLSVAEAGIGFGFLALVISYLPILYQAFSRREITISLLDARAGSPPTAGELLRRLARGGTPAGVGPLLVEWERWSAELLESHLSFPVLSYYRSQHDNQSWVGALTTILDTSALLIGGVDAPESHRLPPADLVRLRQTLRQAGLHLRDEPAMAAALAELRGLYEPFLNALASHFEFALPPFQPERPPVDNWQTSPWMPRSPDLGGLPGADGEDEHRD